MIRSARLQLLAAIGLAVVATLVGGCAAHAKERHPSDDQRVGFESMVSGHGYSTTWSEGTDLVDLALKVCGTYDVGGNGAMLAVLAQEPTPVSVEHQAYVEHVASDFAGLGAGFFCPEDHDTAMRR